MCSCQMAFSNIGQIWIPMSFKVTEKTVWQGTYGVGRFLEDGLAYQFSMFLSFLQSPQLLFAIPAFQRHPCHVDCSFLPLSPPVLFAALTVYPTRATSLQTDLSPSLIDHFHSPLLLSFVGKEDLCRRACEDCGWWVFRRICCLAALAFARSPLLTGIIPLKTLLLIGNLEDNFLAMFLLGWGITIDVGLAVYLIDTMRHRMMMTSGEEKKHSSSLQAFRAIMAKEGTKSLFKGGWANVLSARAGAGVLVGYDELQLIFVGKAFWGGGG